MQTRALRSATRVVVVVLAVLAVAVPAVPLVVAAGAFAVGSVAALAYLFARSRSTAASGEVHRRLVEHVDHVLFEADADLRWTFLNHAWEAATGQSVDAALGQRLTDALHPEDRPDVQTLLGRVVARHATECHLDVRLLTGDRSAHWMELRARLLDTPGRPLALAGTLVDISARRRDTQELQRARLAAEQAGTARSEFLKAMGHEMRTPLNGMLGLMELLEATRLDAQQARYVSVARASAAHLGALLTDILDLSRLEAGGLVLERTLFDLPDLLERSVDAMSRAAAAKGLRLACTIGPDVPTWVVGDPGRLRQVLVTLLANGVKFTAAGDVRLLAGAEIDLHTRRATLRLAVQDTGIGMDAERAARLFLPYAVRDGPHAGVAPGAGLGLTICKRLLEAMGGTIAVHSGDCAGSTFTITLPIDIADAAMVEADREPDTAVRVLAILPDDAERAVVEQQLAGWRFDAAAVGDCESAWTHLEATSASRWRFGVVLLDGHAAGAATLARRLGQLTSAPGVVWVVPQDGALPDGVTDVRDVIARPVKVEALFDAVMQAVVGQASGMATRGAPAWTVPPHVLVAEDHLVSQMVVKELLVGMGCQVALAADGETAVATALAASFDVILMDCQMPVVDGLEATRRIRRARAGEPGARQPRIVALTAHASQEDRQACLEAGMDAYLTKPVRGPVLQRTLHRLLADRPSDETAVAPAPEPMTDLPGSPVPLGEAPALEEIVDPEEVLLRCNHNGDLGARMLQLFAESLPSELEALEMAAASDDTDALSRTAHKIRGAAATLAAVRLAGAISGVERFLEYGDGGPLSDLLADVRHESALFLGAVPPIARRLSEGGPPREPPGSEPRGPYGRD